MLPVPMDRTSGRRSSSIGCRSIVGRRTSVYITAANAQNCDPFKVSPPIVEPIQPVLMNRSAVRQCKRID